MRALPIRLHRRPRSNLGVLDLEADGRKRSHNHHHTLGLRCVLRRSFKRQREDDGEFQQQYELNCSDHDRPLDGQRSDHDGQQQG